MRTCPSSPPVAKELMSLANVIAFTWPSCAISCYMMDWVFKSHTEQIPFNCAVPIMVGFSWFQSKLVTGATCSAFTSCYTCQSNLPWPSDASQMLTMSPDVARKSFRAEVSGAHIIFAGGYSWGKSKSLTSRCVVWGYCGCSLLVEVWSTRERISTLL